MTEITIFLAQAVVISLSGVMAPGPVTTAAIAAGTKSRHAGSLMAIGHGVVEFPLMFLILVGIGVLFESSTARTVIGIVGGIFLLWMGVQMLRDLNAKEGASGRANSHAPLVTGIILSISNPYFLLWWATVGLALAKDARKLGLFAFVLFTIVHWLCDLFWLEVLSWTSFKGSQLMSEAHQRIMLAICALAMLFFGAVFIYRAVW
ncbi:MAG: LysE family transporter [Sedimentisphaerales bacterium]|nr:LysE family transporter [Sedimentisphaerales bacterium]